MAFVRVSLLVLLASVATYFLLQQLSRKRLPVRVDGYVAPGYEQLRAVFRSNFERGAEEGGASYAAYHGGRLVAELWGGYADVDTGTAWRRDTLSLFYSTSKGAAALCLAMLVDRGLVDYETPVKDYWPEFAQHGKDNITVKMAVAHQAGLPSYGEPFSTYEDLGDHARISRLLEQRQTSWPAGRAHGYHGLTVGSLIDQLVRRRDPQHRSVGQFFREEVAQPCDIDFRIGTPREEYHRIARYRWQSMTLSNLLPVIPGLLRAGWSQSNRYMDELLSDTKEFPADVLGWLNSPDTLVHEVPAANGVGSAAAMAKLYNILVTGHTCPGHSRPLLSKRLLREMVTPLTSGPDLVLGKPFTNFSYGFFVLSTPKGNTAFGSPGYGMQDGYGDLDHQVAWAYLTNTVHMDQMADDRGRSLQRALYAAVDAQK